MKTRQDFLALDVATNEGFENSGAFRSWILVLDAIECVRLTQSLAALHLGVCDFALWLYAALGKWIDAHPDKLKMPRAEF